MNTKEKEKKQEKEETENKEGFRQFEKNLLNCTTLPIPFCELKRVIWFAEMGKYFAESYIKFKNFFSFFNHVPETEMLL